MGQQDSRKDKEKRIKEKTKKGKFLLLILCLLFWFKHDKRRNIHISNCPSVIPRNSILHKMYHISVNIVRVHYCYELNYLHAELKFPTAKISTKNALSPREGIKAHTGDPLPAKGEHGPPGDGGHEGVQIGAGDLSPLGDVDGGQEGRRKRRLPPEHKPAVRTDKYKNYYNLIICK